MGSAWRFSIVVLVLLNSGLSATANEPPQLAALRATVRMTNGKASGTAWVVRTETPPRTVLVTAGHVFDEMKDLPCRLIWRAAGPDETSVRREVETPIRDGERPMWVRHPDLDVAAMPIVLPAGVDCQPFAWKQLADEQSLRDRRVQVGQELFIPCFPVQVEANAAGWPILRRGSLATHPLLPVADVQDYYVDYSHFGGDSGAPVVAFQSDQPLVIGLVYAMHRQTENITTDFEIRTIHTPLHLAHVVPAPFIRTTIERLATP